MIEVELHFDLNTYFGLIHTASPVYSSLITMDHQGPSLLFLSRALRSQPLVFDDQGHQVRSFLFLLSARANRAWDQSKLLSVRKRSPT